MRESKERQSGLKQQIKRVVTEQYVTRRVRKLIEDLIQTLKLDLSGLNVLTEAGTNHFLFTPFIAYYAGAGRIYVWMKDTSHGRADEVKERLLKVAKALNVDLSRFEFALNERPVSHVQSADVVTNLGAVRPLDTEFLALLKNSAIISYMCEAWEVRAEDVDVNFCKQRGIKIAGVWENHPDLMIFKGCGILSVKLCLEAGLEVYQNKILVISSDKFGHEAAASFKANGALDIKVIAPMEIREVDLGQYDIVFVAQYSFSGEIINTNVEDRIDQLRNTAVVHLCGDVNYQMLKQRNVFCYPMQQGYNYRMTRTLAHLGLKPVIDLYGAGLKVGQCLVQGIESDLAQPM